MISKFPQRKPAEPPPELSELTVEERDAWNWVTATSASFDAVVINLTPQLARLLMTRVGENRKPKPATIDRYVRAMTRHQWKLTHQGIGISTRFEVIDGQHRLHAVIASGVTIEILVVRGVSQDAMLVLDNGVGRTDADAISISDFGLRDLQPVEVACAKRMIRSARRFMRAPSREDLRTFIIRHRDPIKTLCALLLEHGRVPNVTHCEVAAVLARASYHCSRDDVVAATTFLATGKSDSDRYEPLLTLREWLVKGPDKKQLAQRYGRTGRAVGAFLNGEKLGRRIAEAREELFPLPEERVEDADV